MGDEAPLWTRFTRRCLTPLASSAGRPHRGRHWRRGGPTGLPGTENVDFSVTKTMKFAEARNFEFRTEFFNLLNHFNPDPQTLDRNIRSKTFGTVGAGVQGITTRVIQFGAKLNF